MRKVSRILDTKFTGPKRFGLDGASQLIPALEQIIKRGGNSRSKMIVLAFLHRGPPTFLTPVMGQGRSALFHSQRLGRADDSKSRADVKYISAPRGPRVRRQQGHSRTPPTPLHRTRRTGGAAGARQAGSACARRRKTHHGECRALMQCDAASPARRVGEFFGLSALKAIAPRLGAFHRQQPIGFNHLPAQSRPRPTLPSVAR